MGRHIVGPLQCVFIIGFTFADKSVKYGCHVAAHIRIGILVEGKRRRSMQQEEVQQTRFG